MREGRLRHHHHHRGSTRIVIGGRAGAIINIVVGLVLLGMGVGFVGIAVAVPLLRTSFLLTGGILAAVGLSMAVGGVFVALKRRNEPPSNGNGGFPGG